MDNHKKRDLALKLLHADSSDEVENILRRCGYWDDSRYWRLYGDKEGNFAQAGNQQSVGEAALVEKITNSVDARLMAKCQLKGIDPESDQAPGTLHEAVEAFFELDAGESAPLTTWSKTRQREEAKNITIAATGPKARQQGRMCLTVVDKGEGQSPGRLPQTILSLNARNKQRIPFVQGKFNMGGTGALRFCDGGLQLVISKRHPDLLRQAQLIDDPTASQWSITVVRRESPTYKSGEPIHSEYKYLAPVGAEDAPCRGSVLSFDADDLPLLPDGPKPYARRTTWATAVKLYGYKTDCGQSNVLMPDGLLNALDRLMPRIALPVRLHECRYSEGHKGSFSTTLAGLVARLETRKKSLLEPGFPLFPSVLLGSAQLDARIYVFQDKSKANTYRDNEGILLEINGQCHGTLHKRFFGRPKKVGLGRLKDSLLVVVDCSRLSTIQREDLFMSSRDRLSEGTDIRRQLETELETLLRESKKLKQIQQDRKERDIENRLSDERPLEAVLSDVLKKSPTLNSLFILGKRLPRPFGPTGHGPDGPGTGGKPEPFVGLIHPTIFKFKKMKAGEELRRTCEKGRRVRVAFETDVQNDYFKRTKNNGVFTWSMTAASGSMTTPSLHDPNLVDGIGTVTFELPPEADVGDNLTIEMKVDDPTLQDPFTNRLSLAVVKKSPHKPGPSAPRGSNPTQGLSLPDVIEVTEGSSLWDEHGFTAATACHVITDSEEEGSSFYINMDNLSLKTEMKFSNQNADLLRAKFKYGMVLIALGLLHDSRSHADGDDEENDPAERIGPITQAVAPVLLPLIDQLSGLNEDLLTVDDD